MDLYELIFKFNPKWYTLVQITFSFCPFEKDRLHAAVRHPFLPYVVGLSSVRWVSTPSAIRPRVSREDRPPEERQKLL